MVTNLDIIVITKILKIDKFEGVDIKMTIFFQKFYPKKYPNNIFLVPNLAISSFPEILQLDQFEGTDFKYDNSILKF